MIKTKLGLTFEDFVSKIEESLNVNLDPSSLDIKIFKIFYDMNYKISTAAEEKINSMFFENARGEDLDTIMEFFDNYRLKGGESDIHTFMFYNKGNKSFMIKKNSLINFEDKSYKVLNDTYINEGQSEVYTQLNGSKVEFNSPIYTNDGFVSLGESSIDSVFKNINQLFTGSVKFISYNVKNDEVESDFEFKERSKSLMQSLGLTNSQKIKQEIMKNSGVKNVVVEDILDITKMTIIPKSLSNIDSLMISAKEVSEYYKGSNVVLEKPKILEIDIEGLTSVIALDDNVNAIKESVAKGIIEYLTTDYSNVIYKSKILNIIQTAITNNSDNIGYDLSKIVVKYNFYNKDNYDVPVLVSEITSNKRVDDNTIMTFGILG